MNIPKYLPCALGGMAVIGGLTVALSSFVRDRANTIFLHGTPEQVEAVIRAKFPDPSVHEAAIASMRRRLLNVGDRYSDDTTISEVRGNFYLDPDRGYSLFPAMGGGQTATMSSGDRGSDTTFFDLNLVPQSVSDNTQQVSRVARQ